MQHFVSSHEHMLAELERLDLLVRAQVALVRKLQKDDEQFRGLYISEEDVDALLRQPLGRPYWLSPLPHSDANFDIHLDRISRDIEERKQESLRLGIELRLFTLQQRFRLEPFEIDALLVCLAVELDLRYERLYAYLQDDVTKKKPSVDLVLNLLNPTAEAKLSARRYFLPHATLVREQLLALVEEPAQPNSSLLGKSLKIDDRIAAYLLGDDEMDDRLRPYASSIEPNKDLDDLALDGKLRQGLRSIVQGDDGGKGMVVYLQGPYGVGKRSITEALCRELGIKLIAVDVVRLAAESASNTSRAMNLLGREIRLTGAALSWVGIDVLLDDQHKALLRQILDCQKVSQGLIFILGEQDWQPEQGMTGVTFMSLKLSRPDFATRSEFWRQALEGLESEALDIGPLASKFKFTAGQIQDAVATAENLARWRDYEKVRLAEKDLYEASRLHSNQKLSSLARKITPKYRWNDIVLPADRLAQLREICNHVKYRDRVYSEWGFDRKLALGKGLCVLFAGPSGTGKTMAADIIAGELGLDLYKIDLSTVVSKYIGETEKNLAKVFSEAETSNAILFFDEADALFGKRSEVKDSHDRYANIETGYLLQRVEEHEGAVILASNFRKNMDEAFVRRLHFTVEFPFPNEEDRRRIWEGVWPEAVPRESSLDTGFMARRFQVTGGNIRNIALSAAFLAADDGGIVAMQHLLLATQREYQKMGKVITDGEFRVNSHLLSSH